MDQQHAPTFDQVLAQAPGRDLFERAHVVLMQALARQRLLHGEHFYLEKGRFPMLLPSVMADGEFSCFFQFNESSEEKAKAFYADSARAAAYEKARQQHAEKLAQWKSSNGANVQWLDDAERLRHWNSLNLRRGMGEGGYQGEGYTLECHRVIHDYACGYQNMFGRGVTGLNDIGYFAPRYLATGVWLPGERGGRERLVSQSFGGHGGGTISARYLARSIALCPKEWQPVVLWHWLKQLGVEADEGRDAPTYKLDIEGNSFTLAYPDASLKATFVSPANVKITQTQGRMKAHPLSDVSEATVNAIHASGHDPNGGDFFVVMTLQRGDAPAVKVENGTARVGGRTVTFDRERIRIE